MGRQSRKRLLRGDIRKLSNAELIELRTLVDQECELRRVPMQKERQEIVILHEELQQIKSELRDRDGFTQGRNIGYLEGCKKERQAQEQFVNEILLPMQAVVSQLNMVINYVDGIMSADRSVELSRDLLEQQSNDLAQLLNKADELNRKTWVRYHEVFLDLTPALQYREAIASFRSGETPTGEPLRDLAARHSEIKMQHHEIRKKHLPGRGKSDVIDRLCQRARPYAEAGESWSKIHDALTRELEQLEVTGNMTANEQEEYEKLADYGIDSFRRTYERRNEKAKVPLPSTRQTIRT